MAKKMLVGGPIGDITLTRTEIPQPFPFPSKWRYTVSVTIPTNGDTHHPGYPKCDILNNNSIIDSPTLLNAGGNTWESGAREVGFQPTAAKVIAKFVSPEQNKQKNF